MKALKYLSCIFLLVFQPIPAQDFWQHINGPFGEVDDLFLTKSSHILSITHWDGIHWSSNNGESWTEIITPYGVRVYGTINDSIIIGGSSEHVYVSNDTEKTWNITGDMRISSLYFEPVSQTIYLGSWRDNGYPCGIFTSTDFGQSWILLYPFPSLNLGQAILELYVTFTNQVILVEEYNGGPHGVGYQLYQSADHGQSWQIIYPVHQFPVSSMVEDIYHNLYALAGENNLLISEDECQTWITREIPTSAHLDTDNTGRLYRAYFYPNLTYSTNKGISWHGMDMSGLQGGINDMDINQFNRIYAASTSGIFYAEADSIVVSVEDIEPAKTFYLSQNYPNPFNPVTSIQYVVGSLQFVTLKVYDVLGNEISTLVNEEKQPGTYDFNFSVTSHSGEVRNLTSGIYFYQLRAGSFIETKKMVLMK